MKKLFIAVVGMFILFSACRKSGICIAGHDSESYQGGVTEVIPAKDSIEVGDTIFFSCVIPDNIYYINYNGDTTFNNFAGVGGMKTNFNIITLDSVNSWSHAIDSFDIIPVKGDISPTGKPYDGLTVGFTEENGAYKLSLYLIPKKRGIYSAQILDVFSVFKKCLSASVAIVYANTDQHLHYLQKIYYGGGQVLDFDAIHSYCFKVY